ncbi:MAG: hypothetical protein JXQ67_05285 [Campylobacterales bacterium]|nr:hypothetical protein [Campylobacterales bacterium]
MESLLEADFSYRVENSNFSIEANEPYNYNRLRLRLDYTNEGYFATFIGDGVNYYGDDFVNSAYFALLKEQSADTPISTQSDYRAYNGGEAYAKVYRAYGGYEDESNRIVFGLQNITMGVGRIWTPTNLFNPRNTYAIEPDEIFGVLALSYTRYLSSTSQLTVVASQKADDSYKYALRYKAYLDIADFAINLVASDKTKMLGYELEGNLAQSGVELRSEGAYIKSRLKKSLYEEKDIGYFQGILGADYAFVNGLTLSAEGLYSSKSFSYGEILLNYNSEILPNLVTENFYAALSGVYSFNIYLDGSLVYIDGFHGDESRFISPSLTYTMNDYNSFMLGALLQKDTDRYYLKWTLSF